MPKIIVQTSARGGEGELPTLSERVIAANLESEHYTAQLLERLTWATRDAEALESAADRDQSAAEALDEADAPAPRGVPAQPARGRARVARSAAAALAVIITTTLSLSHTALAASSHRLDRSADEGTQPAAAEVTLRWYDITDQTVTAASYPEPVTQSRAWSVSWLAAARAVAHRHDSNYAIAAFAQALHDTLAAQVRSRQLQLDADLATTLAGVPDGPAKTAGISAGEQQAAEALAQATQTDSTRPPSMSHSPRRYPDPGCGNRRPRPSPPPFAPARATPGPSCWPPTISSTPARHRASARAPTSVGLPVLRRRKSTFIHGIEDDARAVVDHLTESLAGASHACAAFSGRDGQGGQRVAEVGGEVGRILHSATESHEIGRHGGA